MHAKSNLHIAVINISLRPGAKVRFFPVGLGFVMTAIKKSGYDFDFIDQDLYNLSQDEVIAQLVSGNGYDVVLMGCIVTGFRYVKSLVDKIKEKLPDVIVGVGNSVATSIPIELLTYTKADVAFIGEGDITDVEFLDAIRDRRPLSEVDGLAYKDEKGNIVFSKPRQVIQDISDLYVDYTLFDMDKYIPFMSRGIGRPYPVEPLRAFVINTARGCINRCTFCYQVFRNEKYRRRSMEMIMRDVKHVIDKYDINYIDFADDLTFFNKKVLDEFLDWKEKLNLNFYWEGIIRGNLFTGEEDLPLLQRLKENGCWLLLYSLESSSPEILKAMNKHVNLDQFRKQTAIIKKAGIHVATSLVVGYPQETVETIKDTFDVCISSGINPSTGYLLPQPGTEIYDWAKQQGYIDNVEEYLLALGDRQDLRLNMTSMPDDVLVQTVEDNVRRCNKALGVESITDSLLKTQSYYLTDKPTDPAN